MLATPSEIRLGSRAANLWHTKSISSNSSGSILLVMEQQWETPNGFQRSIVGRLSMIAQPWYSPRGRTSLITNQSTKPSTHESISEASSPLSKIWCDGRTWRDSIDEQYDGGLWSSQLSWVRRDALMLSTWSTQCPGIYFPQTWVKKDVNYMINIVD